MTSIAYGAMSYLPLFLVFISGMGFSIQTLVIKLLEINDFEGSYNTVLSRGLNQVIICGLFVYFDEDRKRGLGPKLFGDTNYVSWLLLLRAIGGYGSIMFGFLAIEYLPVGDASTLMALSPIFTAIFSFLVIGESWRVPEFIGSSLAIIGAVLIAKPSFVFGGVSLSPIGVIFALISAISGAVGYVCIRILGTTSKMPFANIGVIQALVQISVSIPSAYILGEGVKLNIGMYNSFLVFLGGFIGAFSQVAMTIGMQREKSASASAMRMSDVVFGYLWQITFTSDKLSILSLCGAIIIASSILLVVVFKQSTDTDKNIVSNSSNNGDIELKGEPVLNQIYSGNSMFAISHDLSIRNKSLLRVPSNIFSQAHMYDTLPQEVEE